MEYLLVLKPTALLVLAVILGRLAFRRIRAKNGHSANKPMTMFEKTALTASASVILLILVFVIWWNS